MLRHGCTRVLTLSSLLGVPGLPARQPTHPRARPPARLPSSDRRPPPPLLTAPLLPFQAPPPPTSPVLPFRPALAAPHGMSSFCLLPLPSQGRSKQLLVVMGPHGYAEARPFLAQERSHGGSCSMLDLCQVRLVVGGWWLWVLVQDGCGARAMCACVRARVSVLCVRGPPPVLTPPAVCVRCATAGRV